MRRWAGVVALGILVGGSAAFTASSVIAPEYRATAQLYLAPASNITTQDVRGGQDLARSYVQLANANVVLRAAIEDVGWTGELKEFRERASVSHVRDTSVMTVSFRHTDPEFGARAANAIARAFITQSKSLQSSLQLTSVQQLDEQVRSLQEDIRSLDLQIAAVAPQDELRRVQLDSARQTKQQTLAQITKTRDDIRLAAARAENTVSLWEEATPPVEPESPRVPLNTLLGALAGGLLVILLIGAFSYFEDHVPDFDAMREKLGLTPLGEVYRSERGETFAGKLFVRDDSSSPAAESFRALRTNILFASVDRQPRRILVTSALPLEGKSVVSANLALAFAHAGTPTVLIDADLRRPSQHRLFSLDPSQGLTTLIKEDEPLSILDDFRVTEHLWVIPSGPIPPNPAELLSSNRMQRLLEALTARDERCTVVIDTSPTLAVTDAPVLARAVDACLLVVDATRTRTQAAAHALDALRRVHAPMLGGVLNKVRVSPSPYYGYYGPAERAQERRHGLFSLRRWLLMLVAGSIGLVLAGALLLSVAQETNAKVGGMDAGGPALASVSVPLSSRDDVVAAFHELFDRAPAEPEIVGRIGMDVAQMRRIMALSQEARDHAAAMLRRERATVSRH